MSIGVCNLTNQRVEYKNMQAINNLKIQQLILKCFNNNC